jgi:Ca-activated chloride channel family protein
MVLGVALVVAVLGCKKTDSSAVGSGGTASGTDDGPARPANAVTLIVAASSEKKAWMEESAKAFADTQPKTASGRPIVIDLRVSGSGEASSDILSGALRPHVYTPASSAYLTLLNQAWMSSASAPHAKPIAPAGEPLVLSPIVIAMWKPMAEALGWPTKDIGWSDILKVSKDPQGWGSLGHAEWGAFKLGHTHPEYSNSGLLAVLAEAYAAAGKTRGLARADLDVQKTKDTMGAIEDSIVHYGKSTGLFADKMLERGPAYMSAAVLYENLVIESYGKSSPMPLVAIYPVEGTFWSDHPYAVLDAEWVGAEEKSAAQAFLAFLKAKPQQARALALGFRPGDSSIPIGAPIDAAHGVDAQQPQTLLEVPNGDMLAALVALWREEKKSAEVVIVFDRSGSMNGDPLTEAKAGAKAFLDGLGDRDAASVLFFNDQVGTPDDPQPLGKSRAKLEAAIDASFADGGTALYDAVAAAYDKMLARAKKQPGRIHALVVMTDGKDESSAMALAQLERRFNPENAPVKIFTIAYGSGADPTILEQIAASAQGTSVKGTSANIVQVYRDLSAFF